MKFKSAFTMIELVFVIVVLGILASVAIPRLAVSRDDATIAKLRADISAIRSGIALKRTEDLMRGVTTWPNLGDNLSNVLSTPLKMGSSSARNGWRAGTAATGGTNGFEACVAGQCTTFTYYQTAVTAGGIVTIPAGTFDCPTSNATCEYLTK